jgi:hypothetical protein
MPPFATPKLWDIAQDLLLVLKKLYGFLPISPLEMLPLQAAPPWALPLDELELELLLEFELELLLVLRMQPPLDFGTVWQASATPGSSPVAAAMPRPPRTDALPRRARREVSAAGSGVVSGRLADGSLRSEVMSVSFLLDFEFNR